MMAAPRILAIPVTVALLICATAAQAEAAPPWNAWAADDGDGRVMVWIEAGAVCGSMVGCPAYVLVDGKVT
ncbi:MAG: hypothetical protein HQL42_15425 [Alphaproteobacteria bacterium]|nr:hypothetical protein [Alphaproteobacteria bacterium]